MSRNNIFITVISVIIIFGFLLLVYGASNSASNQNQTVYQQLQLTTPSDHVKWTKNQKNVLVEFADFQCPACRSFQPILKTYEASGSAESKVASKMSFVFKHFPLENIHKNARASSYAAEAAGRQGKFFEYSDLLYTNQDSWSELGDPTDEFKKYAAELGLDLTQFQNDMKSSAVRQKVDNDILLGNQVKVGATPTFFLNGKMMTYTTLDDFNKQLAEAVKTQ